MIDKALDITRITRRHFVDLVDSLTLEQLNEIPQGFNNNIIWNFGHIVISQQMLCYYRGGITPKIQSDLIPKYVKGSKPEGFVNQDEVDLLKTLAFSLTDELERDIKTEIFDGYESFTTHFGVVLNNIEEAIQYSATHDNQHLGYVMALKKLV